jgi:uncharacterized protein YodC (DUF2158 family)
VENKFNKGDIVVIKSGGPPMTIDQLPGDHGAYKGDEYRCVWFKGATSQYDFYGEHLLENYVPLAKK